MYINNRKLRICAVLIERERNVYIPNRKQCICAFLIEKRQKLYIPNKTINIYIASRESVTIREMISIRSYLELVISNVDENQTD